MLAKPSVGDWRSSWQLRWLAAVAPNLNALIAARFAQGLGASMIMPASMSLIRQAYGDPVGRGRAIAVWAMGGSVAATSGPVIGGLLVTANWRWIFFINLPVGLLTLVLLSRVQPSPRRPTPLDILGQIAAVIAIGLLTYGAIEVGRDGLSSVSVVVPLAMSVVALWGFVVLQRHGSHPMVPPSLLATRNPRLAMAIGFAFMVGYFGLPFVMSLYLQQQRGLSAAATGMAFLPMMMTGLLLTPFSARLVQQFGARNLIVAGLLSMAVGLASLAVLPLSAPTWLIAVLMVLVGAAGPLVAPPVAGVLLSSVPAELAGTASGVFNTSRQVGGALAVAVFGALLVQSSSFMTGMRVSLVLAAGVALITALASWRLQCTHEIAVVMH